MRGAQVKRKRSPAPTEKRGHLSSDFLLKLELESSPMALCLVRATMERAAETLHFQPAESRAIVRSVDEALANVLRHAYKGHAGRPIELTCHRLRQAKKRNGAEGIEIVLRDSGVAVDPSKLHGRALDEIRPGGLGLHFMRQSMDKVEFSRWKGKNQLRLVKYLSPHKQHSGIQGE